MRRAAAAGLPSMGKAAVAPLLNTLQSNKASLRKIAVRILVEIGAAAEPAIPQLKTFLLQPEKGVAEAAAEVLAGIRPRGSRPERGRHQSGQQGSRPGAAVAAKNRRPRDSYLAGSPGRPK